MKGMTRYVLALVLVAFGASLLFSADHAEAPLARANPAADINDLYAFVNDHTLVLAMTVNPFLGAGAAPFDPRVVYLFIIDTNGDAVGDKRLAVRIGRSGRILKFGRLARRVKRIFAGRRDDPFFFDADLLTGGPLGEDSFAGADVAAIVVEIPLRAVTPHGPNIGVWAATAKLGVGPVDRMGRPVINTLFIPSDKKDKFNRTPPKLDPLLWSDFVPDFLLPDILTIDTSQPTAYPNGRALEDDVIDISLALIGAGGTDEVDGNDVPFLDEFPFLAPPHHPSHLAKRAADEPVEAAGIPQDFALDPAFPNPFNPSTEIRYALPADAMVTLKVYNLVGGEVRTLLDGNRAAGRHAVTWDGRDNAGNEVASGIYLYRIEVNALSGGGRFTMARRMTLLR